VQIGDNERAHGWLTISVRSECPVEDPDGLDQRRAEMGLEPFEEYERLMRSGFE